MTKNGIPLDIPVQRKKLSNVVVQKQNDYCKFNKFATMLGFEEDCIVTVVVPVAHPEFKKLKKQGYRVLEVWDKKEVKDETA